MKNESQGQTEGYGKTAGKGVEERENDDSPNTANRRKRNIANYAFKDTRK